MNHRKTDRLLELAERERLPLVMFAEGGGGCPGDTDTTSVAGLDVPDVPADRAAVGPGPAGRRVPATASPGTPRWPACAT